MPNLSSFWEVLKPLNPFSIRKGGHTPRASRRVRLGIHHQRVGVRPIRDPHLGPVQDPAVAALFRRVRMPTTSEPAPGSLIASAPTCSPEISAGK